MKLWLAERVVNLLRRGSESHQELSDSVQFVSVPLFLNSESETC